MAISFLQIITKRNGNFSDWRLLFNKVVLDLRQIPGKHTFSSSNVALSSTPDSTNQLFDF